ncbi:MAG: hypothetical protein LRY54_03305, partial [Alphaproteobacteria bacterium]|nr:hypothetical protein [Alphaproteobacteria bacterium]
AMALAKHGGFPASEIIRVVSYDEYRALTSEGGQTEKNGGGLQIASALFGSGRPPRAVGRHRPGKIDLADTQYLMDAIRRLPRGVPVRDMISLEMYRGVMEDSYRSRAPYYAAKPVKEEDVQAFWDIIGPYCDESTTVDDLEKVGLEYFMRLARQFLESPKEFADSFEEGQYVSHSFRCLLNDGCYSIKDDSPHRDLLIALEERQKKICGRQRSPSYTQRAEDFQRTAKTARDREGAGATGSR